MRLRLRFFLAIICNGMVSIMLTIFCLAQIKNHNQSVLTARQQKIIQMIVTDTIPNESNLAKFKRGEVITALRLAQRDSRGHEAAIYAFLLAYLNDNYRTNKTRLLTIVQSCRKYKPTDWDYECDEDAAWFLHKLYLKGDKSLIRQLFASSKGSDGALSETLGSAYAEIVEKDTFLFLQSLAKFPSLEQKHLIDLTIMQDGSCTPSCLPLKTRILIQQIAKSHRNHLQKASSLFVQEMSNPVWNSRAK